MGADFSFKVAMWCTFTAYASGALNTKAGCENCSGSLSRQSVCYHPAFRIAFLPTGK